MVGWEVCMDFIGKHAISVVEDKDQEENYEGEAGKLDTGPNLSVTS